MSFIRKLNLMVIIMSKKAIFNYSFEIHTK